MSDTRSLSFPRLSRRDFLLLAASGVLLACSGCQSRRREPRVGLALGGGGAKGLAHILMLESLDELGIRPVLITGTSIGAIIGSLYAAALSGEEIRALIEQFFVDREEAANSLFAIPKSLRWLDFIDPALSGGGLLDSSDFIEYLGEVLPVRRFRELDIPLRIVAAELLTGKQVVIDSGELLPALQASMAVPGVFPPVALNGRLLVDGGVANPLPYDLLEAHTDIVIAIDVSGDRDLEEGETLSSLGVLLHSFHNMGRNILLEKLRQRCPTVYVRPEIRNVKVLEFYKAREVLEQARPAQQQFVRELNSALHSRSVQPGCTTG
jgi:NTE family protein